MDGFALFAKPLWLSFEFDLEGRTEFEHIESEKSLEGLKKTADRQRKGQRSFLLIYGPEKVTMRTIWVNKSPQKGQKMAQEAENFKNQFQDAEKNAKKRPQEATSRPQDGPKRSEVGPKMAPRGAKTTIFAGLGAILRGLEAILGALGAILGPF